MVSGAFTSYAQNFEDVMLWRALKHIENGVYVDVGAEHPVNDSVSKAFYERGWRGIHIEPVPQFAELLRKDRPDETVLQIALAEAEGSLDLNVIPGTGRSTFVDAYAERHKLASGCEPQRLRVPVLTLKAAVNFLAGKQVHWLKIDVEGFEKNVLKGWDSETFRPWVIVVEATIPDSPETDYAEWEPLLTAAQYQFVYFDGLNRFYVSKEHGELVEAFSSPPNFFDDVVLSGNSYLCRGVMSLHRARENELTARAETLAAELNVTNEQTARAETLSAELNATNEQTTRLLELERQRTVQLGADLHAAREHVSQSQAHALWLQNEWNAAKAKIDELNQSSHHWWTVADQLNGELQSLYTSKSWRITWPLRKIMGSARWVFSLPTRSTRWTVHYSKRMAKPSLPGASSGSGDATKGRFEIEIDELMHGIREEVRQKRGQKMEIRVVRQGVAPYSALDDGVIKEALATADKVHAVGENLPPMTRQTGFRHILATSVARMFLRLAQIITRDQRQFNCSLLVALRAMNDRICSLQNELAAVEKKGVTRVEALEQRLTEVQESAASGVQALEQGLIEVRECAAKSGGEA